MTEPSPDITTPVNRIHLQVLYWVVYLAQQDGAPRPGEADMKMVTQRLGAKDDREVQRSLFILEGQKLVTPVPPGSFTSRYWRPTEDGIKLVAMLTDQEKLRAC